MKNQEIRHLLARLSLAVIFIGIGAWEIAQPSYWSYYIPSFVTALASANTLTVVHGILLLVVGLAVLLGAYLRIASALGVLVMLSILGDLLVSFGFTDIVIRDLVVLLVSAALFFDDTRFLRLTKA
jgi:uncharacterized membrane protein